MIKTPKFWTQRNIISYALLPLSLFYVLGFYVIKFLAKKEKISKPIICIGNIIAGGSGKTPTAIAIGGLLQEMAIDFVYLSRGYMGDGSEFLSVNSKSSSKQVGDESILLSEIAKTFIAKNRLFGAYQIDRMSDVEMIIVDDGMQNNSLNYDYIIAVIDAGVGFGNEFLIPAGPMREPINSGLNKADLVIVIGEAKESLLNKLATKKIIQAKIKPSNIDQFQDKKIMAFCGLAYPQKFFSLLKSEGVDLVNEVGFPDHHNYKNSELEEIMNIAQVSHMGLVTTKKDWVKFPQEFKEKIPYLDITLELDDKEFIKKELEKLL